MEFTRAIVSGGAGFIGTHLVARLAAEGKRVLVIDTKKVARAKKIPGVVYVAADIRNKKISKAVMAFGGEILFHLAAHIHDRESIEAPVMNADQNILGSLQLFEAFRLAGGKKIVFASSCAVYGNPAQLPVHADDIPMPGTPYGISKRAVEMYLDFYGKVRGMPWVALRKANVYGPGQDASAESGVVSVFTSRLLNGDPIFVNNDGESTRDYVFVDDVVDAYLQAAAADTVGAVNIGGGAVVSTNDIFTRIATHVGVNVVPEYREEVQDIIKHMQLDIADAKARLGWEPRTSFDEGIAKTVEWYRKNI